MITSGDEPISARPAVRLIPPARLGERRRALAALPAAAVLGGTLIVFGLVRVTGSQDLASRYEREAEQALAAGDYETARVCFERLMQRAPGNPAYAEGLLAARAAAAGASAGRDAPNR